MGRYGPDGAPGLLSDENTQKRVRSPWEYAARAATRLTSAAHHARKL
jgi:hypothetical protein